MSNVYFYTFQWFIKKLKVFYIVETKDFLIVSVQKYFLGEFVNICKNSRITHCLEKTREMSNTSYIMTFNKNLFKDLEWFIGINQTHKIYNFFVGFISYKNLKNEIIKKY